MFRRTIAVIVNNVEAEILVFLEKVAYLYSGSEVRVEVVVDLLGLPHLRVALKDVHLGIRLAEHIKVLELATRDCKFDFHRKTVGYHQDI